MLTCRSASELQCRQDLLSTPTQMVSWRVQGHQGGNSGEAYNIYVGVALRPGGRHSYRSYERPMFPVADNGSMLITRQ